MFTDSLGSLNDNSNDFGNDYGNEEF